VPYLRYHQAPTKKPGYEAAPDWARPRTSRFLIENGGFSDKAFCAKAQKSNQSVGFGLFAVSGLSLSCCCSDEQMLVPEKTVNNE
jgi:hypothetical protein